MSMMDVASNNLCRHLSTRTPQGKTGRVFEVNFGVVWYTIKVGTEKLNMIENPKYKSRNKCTTLNVGTYKYYNNLLARGG